MEPNAIWLNEKNGIWLEIPRYENQISWSGGDTFAFLLVPFIFFFSISPILFWWDIRIFSSLNDGCSLFPLFFLNF